MNKQQCHKCDFSDNSEEKFRTHLLFEHGFYKSLCSTEVAKQANIDYEVIRDKFKTITGELMFLKDRLLKNISSKHHTPIMFMYGKSSQYIKYWNYSVDVENFTISYRGNRMSISDLTYHTMTKKLMERVRIRLTRILELEDELNKLNYVIRKEGILVF